MLRGVAVVTATSPFTPPLSCRSFAAGQLAEQAPELDGHGVCAGSGRRRHGRLARRALGCGMQGTRKCVCQRMPCFLSSHAEAQAVRRHTTDTFPAQAAPWSQAAAHMAAPPLHQPSCALVSLHLLRY